MSKDGALMDPGLGKLLRLRFRGGLRQLLRGMKTVRGAIYILIGAALMTLWLWPLVVMMLTERREADPAGFRENFPLAMLGLTLLMSVQAMTAKGIHFTPAEVDLLFGAPFTRRQLLLYKIATAIPGMLFLPAMFSLYLLAYEKWWLAGFFGLFLATIYLQLVSMAVALVAQTLGEYAYTRVRKTLSFLTLGGVILVATWIFSDKTSQDVLAWAKSFRESTYGSFLLAPLESFGRVATARTFFPEIVGWGSLAIAVDLALLALVLRLDVNYLESSVTISQKLYERIQRARRGTAWVGAGKARGRVPSLPWFGGAGPIARQQMIKAVRSVPSLLMLLGIVGLGMVVMGMVFSRTPNATFGMVVGQLVVLTFMFTRMLACDFRGNLDHMDWLKSLPLRSLAVAAGELVTPVLLLTTIHLLALVAAAPFVEVSPAILAAIAVFLVPANTILFGLENLIFLLFPMRMPTGAAANLQTMGRSMVEMFVKMGLLALAFGVAAAAGAIVYFFVVESWVLALAVAWTVLVAIAALLIPCIAWAFDKFDVSRDTPV